MFLVAYLWVKFLLWAILLPLRPIFWLFGIKRGRLPVATILYAYRLGPRVDQWPPVAFPISTAMSRQDNFDRIVTALHDAALDDTVWPHTSLLIDDTVGMTGSHLLVIRGHSRKDAEFVFGGRYDHGDYTEGGREYAQHYFPHDERIPRVLRLPDSCMVHVTEVYIARERKTSRTDNALLCRDDAGSGLNVRLDGPDGLHIGWALADPLDPHSWGTAQLTLIERLLPYLRQFVRVRQALAAADALHASLPHLLDHALIGVFVLNRRGTIVETNTRGLRILQRAPGTLPLTLHVSPVPHRADFGARYIAVLVLLVDPAERPRIDPACLATTLGLTRAESYVAAALAAVRSVRDIAVAMRRTQATIRAHVRQLHHELGLHTQAILVRLVLTTAGVPLPRA